MNRAIKASIAALAFVPALGFGMSAPAGADGEIQINLNPNHCQAYARGGSARCVFFAAPDFDSYLYVEELSGAANATATATLRCNNTQMTSPVVANSGQRASHPPQHGGPWSNSGGVCELTVQASGTNHVMAWTAPNPTP